MPLARVEMAGETAKAKGRLVAAAVALGIGRAAVAHAMASMKKNGVKPGPDDDRAALGVCRRRDRRRGGAAADLFDAAQTLDRGEDRRRRWSRARSMFAARRRAARRRRGDSAWRAPAAISKGGLLERLSRDARTLQVIRHR